MSFVINEEKTTKGKEFDAHQVYSENLYVNLKIKKTP